LRRVLAAHRKNPFYSANLGADPGPAIVNSALGTASPPHLYSAALGLFRSRTRRSDVTNQDCSRREFVALAGLLVGSTLPISCTGSRRSTAGTSAEPATSAGGDRPPSAGHAANEPLVPKRPFGKSGVHVSALALGGYFDTVAQASVLERAFALGVTYWETTLQWGGKGYGAYFARNPGHRSEIFLLAKTRATEVQTMAHDLDSMLIEIGTPYVDFFVVQGVDDVSFLNPAVRHWVEQRKDEGKLKFFGFATHKNMERCLRASTQLGWIDGVVTAYNYRLMQQPEMQDAIAACGEKGIALTAIKSQGLNTNPDATVGDDSPAAQQLLARLTARGLSEHQAKLMAVWSNPHIASICSLMPDDATLLSNTTAASQWQRLGAADLQALWGAARATMQGYCAGCGSICEATVESGIPIADVMRYLMYARSYRDVDRARTAFSRLPPVVRHAIARQDYALAEQRCPQGMPISKLMRQALDELA
jgi:hypothetical protein